MMTYLGVFVSSLETQKELFSSSFSNLAMGGGGKSKSVNRDRSQSDT